MLKIRRSHERLISNIGIHLSGKDGYILRWGPANQLLVKKMFPSLLFLSMRNKNEENMTAFGITQ